MAWWSSWKRPWVSKHDRAKNRWVALPEVKNRSRRRWHRLTRLVSPAPRIARTGPRGTEGGGLLGERRAGRVSAPHGAELGVVRVPEAVEPMGYMGNSIWALWSIGLGTAGSKQLRGVVPAAPRTPVPPTPAPPRIRHHAQQVADGKEAVRRVGGRPRRTH